MTKLTCKKMYDTPNTEAVFIEMEHVIAESPNGGLQDLVTNELLDEGV